MANTNQLLHGNHTSLSRHQLATLKLQAQARGVEVISLNLDSTQPEDIEQTLTSKSLFGSSRLTIIEASRRHFSRHGPSSQLQLSLDLARSSQVIFYFPFPLSPHQLQLFSSYDCQLFKISPLVFQFLNHFDAANFKQMLLSFNQACHQNQPEFVFYLLIKHLQAIISPTKTNSLPPWAKKRCQPLLERLGINNLIRLHQQLVNLDFQLKSGRLVSTLESELAFLLTKFSILSYH